MALFSKTLEEFIVAEENKPIILYCRLNNNISKGRWYKDNTLIESSEKFKISHDGSWYSLEITSVNKDHEGIYCFAVKTIPSVYSKCLLFVKPQNHETETYYYTDNVYKDFDVSAPSFQIVNRKGATIYYLAAQFSTMINNFTWFRNNLTVDPKYPMSSMRETEGTLLRLHFREPMTIDSGIYCVVGKTDDDKYMCSYADILTDSPYTQGLYNNFSVPTVCKGPTTDIEVYDKDIVRIMYEVIYDKHTFIGWIKDDKKLQLNDRIKCEIYFNRFIALKISGVTVADSGLYALTLRNKRNGESAIGTAQLTVKNYTPRPDSWAVKTSLKPTIVSVGNGATFRASFSGKADTTHHYVVWTVGHYDVEKSNSRFTVIKSDRDYILYIPVVTPEMNGEICCHLRKHMPPKRSILLSTTKSYLIVVPPTMMTKILKTDRLLKLKNIYSDLSISLLIPGPDSNTRWEKEAPSNNVILDFQFCRMSGGNFCFEVINKEKGSEVTSVSVENEIISPADAVFRTMGDCNISWDRPNKNNLYGIDVCEGNEMYSQIGISDSPSLYIVDPPEDQLLKFRVRKLQPRPLTDANPYYAPKQLHIKDWKSMIISNDEYNEVYTFGQRIDHGTFGMVNLVYCNFEDEAFVAKTFKLSKKKKACKRAEYMRELNILKNLSHPNIIRIVDWSIKECLTTSTCYVTMEYLWGGQILENTIHTKTLAEIDAIVYIKQIVSALEYIHTKNIAYLNISPNNIICLNRNSRIVKLIDFGMARILSKEIILPPMTGSKNFVPPEIILNKPVGTFCDMWSLGILVYWLLMGIMPFDEAEWGEKRYKMSQEMYTYNGCKLISDRAKEFLDGLLQNDPLKRITATTALYHFWIILGPGEGRPRTGPTPEPEAIEPQKSKKKNRRKRKKN